MNKNSKTKDLRDAWQEALVCVAKKLGIDFSNFGEVPFLLEKVSFERVNKKKLCPKILIFSGPTGVGKNFICDILRVRLKIEKIPNVFTRPRRPNESADEFIYMNEEEFLKSKEEGLFVQINQRHGYWHGLLRSRIEFALASDKLYYMDKSVPSAIDLLSKFPRSSFFLIYILPPSFDELIKRIVGRELQMRSLGFSPHEIYENVLERIETSIHEFSEGGEIYDLFVVNDEIDRAVSFILNVLNSVQT